MIAWLIVPFYASVMISWHASRYKKRSNRFIRGMISWVLWMVVPITMFIVGDQLHDENTAVTGLALVILSVPVWVIWLVITSISSGVERFTQTTNRDR